MYVYAVAKCENLVPEYGSADFALKIKSLRLTTNFRQTLLPLPLALR